MEKLKKLLLTGFLAFAMAMTFTAIASPTYNVVYATDGDEVVEEEEETTTKEFEVKVEDGKLINTLENSDNEGSWNTILTKLSGWISGITGVATIIFVIFFIIYAVKLAGSADNPSGRRGALSGVLWTGVGAAITGSVFVIMGIFYNFGL